MAQPLQWRDRCMQQDPFKGLQTQDGVPFMVASYKIMSNRIFFRMHTI